MMAVVSGTSKFVFMNLFALCAVHMSAQKVTGVTLWAHVSL